MRAPKRCRLARVRLDPVARKGPLMPGFAGTFTDAQLADLLRYLRAHYSAAGAWSDLDGAVRSISESRGWR